jgi:predicted nuclease of restriction endonuclease-like (RecB) superfamily
MIEPRASQQPALSADYPQLLSHITGLIEATRVKAVLSVNCKLIELYFDIGRRIVERQESEGWGRSVVQRLSADIRHKWPDIKGFSLANMWRMRSFYLAWRPDSEKIAQDVRELEGQGKQSRLVAETPTAAILAQAVREIPWGHNILLMQKLKPRKMRLWYAQQTIEYGWSRAVLQIQIKTDLYGRTGKAITNFKQTLPAPESDLIQQTLKDPYVFDFLQIDKQTRERDLENQLIEHIQRFLLELGAGFAFVGRQYELEIGGSEYFIDLLFYHLRLHCYVVIDLKIGGFKPEYAGKMNFYLSAVDDLLRDAERDGPTLGLLLCREKNKIAAEYALRDINKPLAVAEWTTQLTRSLPKELQSQLPTIEQIESELSEEL